MSLRQISTALWTFLTLHDKRVYNSNSTYYLIPSISASSMGCAAYNNSLDQKFYIKIGFKSSSMFGELWSLFNALEIAVGDRFKKCVFFTDSLLACKTLINDNCDNYTVAVFHNKLAASNIESCHVVWTSSHCGIEADAIAKIAYTVLH